jgi:hypothetical protein
MTQRIDPTTSRSSLEPENVPATKSFSSSGDSSPVMRHDWSTIEATAIYDSPFMDLLLKAQLLHRAVFDPNKVQIGPEISDGIIGPIQTSASGSTKAKCQQRRAMSEFKLPTRPR